MPVSVGLIRYEMLKIFFQSYNILYNTGRQLLVVFICFFVVVIALALAYYF